MSTKVGSGSFNSMLDSLNSEMETKQNKLYGIMNDPNAKPGDAKKAEQEFQQTMLKFETISRVMDKIMDTMRLIVSKLDAR
jgi:hypothetical protein